MGPEIGTSWRDTDTTNTQSECRMQRNCCWGEIGGKKNHTGPMCASLDCVCVLSHVLQSLLSSTTLDVKRPSMVNWNNDSTADLPLPVFLRGTVKLSVRLQQPNALAVFGLPDGKALPSPPSGRAHGHPGPGQCPAGPRDPAQQLSSSNPRGRLLHTVRPPSPLFTVSSAG